MKPWVHAAATVAVALALGLAMTAMLSFDKLRSGLVQLDQERAAASVVDARNAIAAATALGLPLSHAGMVPDILARTGAADPALVRFSVFDRRGRLLYAVPPAPAGGATAVPDAWRIANEKPDGGLWFARDGDLMVAGVPIPSAAATPTGGVAAHFDVSARSRAIDAAARDLTLATLALVAGLSLVVAFASRRWVGAPQRGPEDAARRLTVVTLAAMLAASALLLAVVYVIFDHRTGPSVAAKAEVVATLATGELGRAYALGIPVDRLRGVAQSFAQVTAEHGEIAGLQLADADGGVLAAAGSVPATPGPNRVDRAIGLPDGTTVALSVAIDPGHVAGRLQAIAADLAIVLFVAMLAAGELVGFSAQLAARSGPRADAVPDLRFPLFVYFVASELYRPFLPMFIAGLYQPNPWIGEGLAIAIPMSVWVMALVVATPFAGRLLRRHGVRRTLAFGMVPTAVGLALTGLSQGIADLILWRSVTAAGFGLVMAVGTLHSAQAGPADRRTRRIGVFFATTIGASVCAAAIGGLLADRIGHRPTFFVAAAMVMLAVLVTRTQLRADVPAAVPPAAAGARARVPSWLAASLDLRFLLFMALTAIPARLVLTGFVLMAVPLQLAAMSYDEAATGRVLMVYFLGNFAMIGLTSRLADEYGAHRAILVGGSLVMSIGVLLFARAGGLGEGWEVACLALAAVLVGVGQNASRAPLIAYLPIGFPDVVARHGQESLLVGFRTLERVGSIAGPFVAAGAIAVSGHATAAAVLAGGLLATTVALWLFVRGRPGGRMATA